MPPVDRNVPHIAVLGATPQEIAALPQLKGMVWILCAQTGQGIYEFQRNEHRLAILDFSNIRFDLPEMIAIVGRAGDPSFAALAETWTESLPSKPLRFRETEDFTPPAIMAAAIETLSQSLAAQQQQCGRFALDLAAYRDEFDRLEYGFAALETYVAQAGLKATRELFLYPAGNDTVDLAADAPMTGARHAMLTLTQLLPVNSIGVSAVALSLTSVPPAGSQRLSVTLRAVETGKIAGVWQIDPADAAVGWNSLPLYRAIDEIALTLVLEICWPPGVAGWKIDLGAPHPNTIMCAQRDGGDPLCAPIAMRILGSVPGMTSTAAIDLAPPVGVRKSTTISVPQSAYAAVKTVGRDLPDDVQLVVYDRDAEFIQVHPAGPGKVTVAHITVTPPIPALRLTARIHLAHENANQTDFGLLVQEEGHPPPDFAVLAKDLGVSTGFSGWHTLLSLQHGTLSVLLSGLPDIRLSVYLLTTQKGTPEFGWARFSDLQLHLAPPGLLSPGVAQAAEAEASPP